MENDNKIKENEINDDIININDNIKNIYNYIDKFEIENDAIKKNIKTLDNNFNNLINPKWVDYIFIGSILSFTMIGIYSSVKYLLNKT